MNILQILLFCVYVESTFLAGMAIHRYINPKSEHYLNRAVLFGEFFLLGNIYVIGMMVLLSLIGLYRIPVLWLLVLSNYAVLIKKEYQDYLKSLIENINWDWALKCFVALVLIFVFRNCYFLVDVDSHSSYLFAQKLWLEKGSSLVGDISYDIRAFVPHFNAVPYGLGIGLFGQSTVFPQLIVAFWTVMAMLLVFGFMSARFNRPLGLAATMLMVFDPHIFFSGANSCCIVNGALVVLIFGVVMNFWEARDSKSNFRLLLALIFASQLLANKYQMIYMMVAFGLLGLILQQNVFSRLKQLFKDKPGRNVLLAAIVFTLLWCVKNLIVMGDPLFPAFSGLFGYNNWDKEMAHNLNKIFVGALSPALIFKYLNYLFIWAGVKAQKVVAFILPLMPILFFVSILRRRFDQKATLDLCYWLGVSVLFIVLLCLSSFFDPRHYRYGIAVMSVTSVMAIQYLLRYCVGLRSELLVSAIILVFAVSGYKIVLDAGKSSYKRPSIKDNIAVMTNRLKMEEIKERYYPNNIVADQAIKAYGDQLEGAAWDLGTANARRLSAFLLPAKPQVGLWLTTVVKWDSYEDEKAIVQDLKDFGITSVIHVSHGQFEKISLERYAKKAVNYIRFPKQIFYNYGFPKELSDIKY